MTPGLAVGQVQLLQESTNMNWQNKKPCGLNHRADSLPSNTMLDHPQNCFRNGDHTCNVGKGCTKAIPQGTTTFPLKSSPKKTMELKVKIKERVQAYSIRWSLFCQFILYAAVIQRPVYQPSKLGTGVRHPSAAPTE